jgi:Rho GDP-dissociation inhibitor
LVLKTDLFKYSSFVSLGSRAPSGEIQTYVSDVEQAPSGVLSRGSFLVKSKLTDDDKHIYAEWEWNLVISKDWQ